MRYIDSGTRDPAHALGTWLNEELTPDVAELRWQTGFFSADGLAVFAPTLRRMREANSVTNVVIGSNDGDTLQTHVLRLVELMGLPRSFAKLGAVSYSGAYYHPKTYHLRRTDGSQAAYVGSANLGISGLSALHVEAGLILDSRNGDSTAILNDIAAAADAWFANSRPGFELIDSNSKVANLTARGVFSVSPPPRVASHVGSGETEEARPRLQPLVRFPGIARIPSASSPTTAVAPMPHTVSTSPLPAAPQSPYPPYVLFAPGASSATTGAAALTGAALAGGYVGLVIRLNRDSARHWRGGSGTANISVPVPTVSTLRFGTFQGKFPRPRAEYGLEMRYLTTAAEYRATHATTSIMVYGFSPGESGHGDVRMVVPASPAREILNYVQSNGLTAPADGDVALLEWPNIHQPDFRLSLIDPASALFQEVKDMLIAAGASNQLVGQGACWLSPGISPNW